MEHVDESNEHNAKANVLVIGNSGVGKSTLINAVLGEDRAETSFGTEGTTRELKLYGNNELPFRIIDSVGFEPSFWKRRAAIRATKKWSKESAKEGNTDTQINVIWFCVEGTSSKLFPETIANLTRATSMWPSVPIIAVITKSYSIPDRTRNIEMVNNAFANQRHGRNLKKVIPVVAETYVLNETAFAPTEGITDLIDFTTELLPEGCHAAEQDVARFKLNRRRVFAHSTVAAATTSGVLVGAIPIPIPDAAILGPVEIAEVNALAKIYGINNDEDSRKFLNSIVEVGTVSIAAKTAINALKAIPGINIGAAVLNAVIAGGIVAALGEACVYAFEQVYLGNKSVRDIDWITKFIESQLASGMVDRLSEVLKNVKEDMSLQQIAEVVLKALSTK